MTDHFGRPGRRAVLARLLHEALSERGMAPRSGAARAVIDSKITEIAAELGISEATALKQVREPDVVQLAGSTADAWHAAKAVSDAAGDVAVAVPADSAAQLVAGLAMAVGQLVREAFGELPASAGEPLDAIGELGIALRDALKNGDMAAEVTLQTLSQSRGALLAAATGVADGTVPVVVDDTARPQFARQLYADAELALRLQR